MWNLRLVFVLALATGFISDKALVSSQSPSSPPSDDLYLEGRPSGDFPVDDEDGDVGSGSGSGSGDSALTHLIEKGSTITKFVFNATETTPDKEASTSQPETRSAPHVPATTAASSQDPATTVEDTTTTQYILPEKEEGEKEEKLFGGKTEEEEKKEEEETEVPQTHPTTATDESHSSSPPSEPTPTEVHSDVIKPEEEEDNFLPLPEDKVVDVVFIEDGNEILTKEDQNELMAKNGHGGRMIQPGEVTSENLWERTEVLAAVIACGVVGFLCAVFLLMLLAYRMKKKDEGSYDLGDTKLSSTAYHKAPDKEFYA
ncbi:uncharacterized protein LOC143008769 [Genypterus blacodes]|uniref:uncharacterized protein LOC143008769 n=1 Tax=Genypterus blacodes TaxID=154954 RepID=UPI003F76D365